MRYTASISQMMKPRLSEGEGLAPDLTARKWLPRGDLNPSSQILKGSEGQPDSESLPFPRPQLLLVKGETWIR